MGLQGIIKIIIGILLAVIVVYVTVYTIWQQPIIDFLKGTLMFVIALVALIFFILGISELKE